LAVYPTFGTILIGQVASRAPTTARPVKAIVAVEDLIFLKVIGQVDAPGWVLARRLEVGQYTHLYVLYK
jgi:hypothetical protein